ncbi:Zinc carboxypeptidase [Paraburkholderia fungorum]|uniref:Zinc carboxypeptidase n=2 Tax=Paraburkholderia fungorum TaxID=134537 RepID=A0A1H1JVC9_9BURK|nr:Zinc carboxypeptidase [Paraburkholderia fungorum]
MNSITSPKEFLGHEIGEDYYLANYTQLVEYWTLLATQSSRIKMVDIGATGYGRRQYMLIISSPDNLVNADKHRDLARTLAQPYDIDHGRASELARDGKAVVFIDAGVHHNEILPTQTLFELAWRLASGTDRETLRILDEVVLLLVHANPDGHEDFACEYMRERDPAKRPVEWRFATPELMPRYAGSDINRDYHFTATAETRNVAEVMYREWFPQVAYDPHQTGPLGGAMYVPPFRDPNNAYTPPLVLATSAELGMAVHHRLIAEGKVGSYMQNAAPYTAWTNGMSTTTAHLHNVVGILSEVIGTPHPQRIPFVPARHVPSGIQPLALAPQIWQAATTIEYQISAQKAVLAWVASNRERLLMATYTANRDAIEAGNRDTWTMGPSQLASLTTPDPFQSQRIYDAFDRASGIHVGNLRGWSEADPSRHASVLRKPALRNPRGYIIPSDQPDFANAVSFANVLLRGGVRVERAKRAFIVGTRNYAAGSLVVKTAQPYRPFILDMFESHEWPSMPLFSGGPIELPYDAAGYTLAYQMGIEFDRILEGFDGPFETIESSIAIPSGRLIGGYAHSAVIGFVVGCESNHAYRLINRLLAAGKKVHRICQASVFDGVSLRSGAFWIPQDTDVLKVVSGGIQELGLDVIAQSAPPCFTMKEIRGTRIGIVSKFGGVRSAGWLQWTLDEFEFPHTVMYPGDLMAGNWGDTFDVLFLTDGSINKAARDAVDGEPVDEAAAYLNSLDSTPISPMDIPDRYHHMLGDVEDEKTLQNVRDFLTSGGSVVGIGSGTNIASPLGCPVSRHDGRPYIPLSVVKAKVDNEHPLAWGMGDDVNLIFDHSPVFSNKHRERSNCACWFDGRDILQSGFALREDELAGAAAIVSKEVGKGRLILIGPEVNFRGQTSGAYKFIFNAIFSVSDR